MQETRSEGSVSLQVGSNKFDVVVYAEDDSACTYTVVVERLPPVLSMTLIDEGVPIQLNKQFVWDAYDYVSDVDYTATTSLVKVESPVMDGFPDPCVQLKVMMPHAA